MVREYLRERRKNDIVKDLIVRYERGDTECDACPGLQWLAVTAWGNAGYGQNQDHL